MNTPIWDRCLSQLENELTEQQLNTWIRPLQATHDGSKLVIMAPNQFVRDAVETRYVSRIREIANLLSPDLAIDVALEIGGSTPMPIEAPVLDTTRARKPSSGQPPAVISAGDLAMATQRARLNADFVFDNFVEGKSNQLGRAAAMQIGINPGSSYNPFFICGASGLGKTHLMHAVGNSILKNRPGARVMYLNSERYVSEMVSALQRNTIQKKSRASKID